MKLKTTLTMLSAVIVLGMPATNANSQTRFSGPRNMGSAINATSNDLNAVISPNGLSLYFSSNRGGNNDIYVSQRATLNSAWGAPQSLGATINTSSAEAMGSLSLDGKTMFFQSNRLPGQGGRDNYVSTRTNPNDDFGWTAPVNLGAIANSPFDDLAATYFEDPTTGAGSIIFSSNRIGDPLIDFHFYQSTRNPDGTFNTPTPITELNIGAELRSAIRRDGLEIFFSGVLPPPPGGQDNFDIWVSKRASTASAWSAPERVTGINSAVEEASPSLSPDGSVLYFNSLRAGGTGGVDLYSATRCSLYSATPCTVNRTVSDFNGDGISDISVFRPSEGNWYIMESGTNTFRAEHFGLNGDKIVPGDYDGDALIDLAVFRPSTGIWWIQPSSNPSNVLTTHWGLATDKPVPGDYDGDGETDVAVYRDGTWYIVHSSTGQVAYSQWGLPSDIPIAGSNTQ